MMKRILQWWLAKRRAAKIRRAAVKFNRARVKAHQYDEWMCPACGKVSKGIDHPYRFMSGMKFPACCRRWCFHGWRSFYDDYIPDIDSDLQPMEEFKP